MHALPVAMGAVSYFVQYILAAFAMLAITSEFATRSITVTLVCTPSRTRVILAKTAVVGSLVLVAAVLVTGFGVVAGAMRFDELGDLGAAQLVAVLKIGIYLALLAVLALGIGTLVRRTAGGLAVLRCG
jgi:ABC-2 type transport system permease protein